MSAERTLIEVVCTDCGYRAGQFVVRATSPGDVSTWWKPSRTKPLPIDPVLYAVLLAWAGRHTETAA